MTQYIRLRDAAHILDVSEQTIRNYIYRHKVRAKKVVYPERVGRQGKPKGWVVLLDDVKELKVGEHCQTLIPKDDYDSIAKEYIETDATYQSIADRYNVSRERIRQVIELVEKCATAKKRARRAAEEERQEREKQTKRLLENMAYAIENDLRCYTCGAWVLRSFKVKDYYICCSDECSEAMLVLRHFDEHDEHRMMQAKSIMRRVAEGADIKPSRVEWAKRMFSDDPPPANRRFFMPGSKRVKVIMKHRPEEFKEIIRSCDPESKTYKVFKHVLSDSEEDQVPD